MFRRVISEMKQILRGGRGDKLNPKDVDPRQLAMGIKVEKEHAKNNPRLAREIAMDHLAEIPDYYSRLKRMERAAGIKD